MDRTPAILAARDAQKLQASLGKLPEPVSRPFLIVLSGLPGTGKTFLARRLAQRLPLAILESDALRKVLFSKPSYRWYENKRLFSAIHILITELLSRGISVLLDATNLIERERRQLYTIADKSGSKLILVQVTAPESVVKDRLQSRSTNPAGYSDADWLVYQSMKPRVQEIKRPHLVVSSAGDILRTLDQIVTEAVN